MNNQNYINIKEASKILGVSPLTLRNWDKNGRLKAFRHPLNNYRVYKIEDLEALMKEIETVKVPAKTEKKEFKKITIQHLSD
jgi:DNA-binding transcriptional MerR regulator